MSNNVNNDFLDELAGSDHGQDSERMREQYTIVQWQRGQKAMRQMGGVAYAGGFVVQKEKMVGDFGRLGWDEIELQLGQSEDLTICHAALEAQIAVIRKRFRWETSEDKPQGYGRLQVLALIKGADDPVIFTFRSTMTQAVEACLREFQTKAIRPLESLTKNTLPLYALWMTVRAGQHAYAKSKNGNAQSEVTPPMVVLPDQVGQEWLKAHYTGKSVMDRCQELFRATQEWADEWKDGAKAHTWACGGALQRQFEALLSRLAGDDENERQSWINDALLEGDVDEIAQVHAKAMGVVIRRMQDELDERKGRNTVNEHNRRLAAAASAKREAARSNTPPIEEDEEILF